VADKIFAHNLSSTKCAWMQWLTPLIPNAGAILIQRTTATAQTRQKVSDMPFQSISWLWWYMPVIPAMWEAIGRRIMV
jgi:hypothetical protein